MTAKLGGAVRRCGGGRKYFGSLLSAKFFAERSVQNTHITPGLDRVRATEGGPEGWGWAERPAKLAKPMSLPKGPR